MSHDRIDIKDISISGMLLPLFTVFCPFIALLLILTATRVVSISILFHFKTFIQIK